MLALMYAKHYFTLLLLYIIVAPMLPLQLARGSRGLHHFFAPHALEIFITSAGSSGRSYTATSSMSPFK